MRDGGLWMWSGAAGRDYNVNSVVVMMYLLA